MIKRKEFIELFTKKGYTKRDAGIIMDDMLATLTEILASGDSVMFHGFGTFEVKEYAQKESIDLLTKERITIPAFKAVKFLSGNKLKRAVKEGFVRD